MREFLNSYSNVFVAIASLGTLISSLVVLLTLLEMKRQRVVSLKPQLILKESTMIQLFYRCSNDNLFIDPFRWENDNSLNQDFTHPFIDMYNIGNGPAQSIEVKWEFDVQQFINEIKKRDTENLFKITCLNNSKDNLLLKTQCSLMTIEQSGFISNFEFLLPTSNNNSTINLPISKAYISLYSILLFLVMKDEDSLTNLEFNNIPGSKILINYRDSQNNKYTREYQLSFSFLSARRVTSKTKKDDLMFSALIILK